MKKIFKDQIRLRKQIEEQTTHLERIEEGLRRSQSVGPSTTAGQSLGGGDILSLHYFMHVFYLYTLETMHEIGMGG